MKRFINILSILLALALMLPTAVIFVNAAPTENWLFIDGVNITRQVDFAVIYRGVERTGQNQWGFDIIVDGENKVTSVVKSGEAETGGTVVPQGGFIVSASGTKTEWLEKKVSVGDTVYYDEYTQKLFVCDNLGDFDPYFEKEFNIEAFGDAFVISEEEGADIKTDFVYAITVDGEGRVISRGRKADIPEGGFTLYATTESARNDLIAFAPLGAVCTLENDKAILKFDKKDIDECLEIALNNATNAKDKALAAFADVNYNKLNALLEEATDLGKGSIDYKSVCEMAFRLESETGVIGSEEKIIELRSAFHTPDETSDTAVRATVLAAKAAGLNSIILRVSNGYGTCIPLPQGNKFSQDEKFNGFDVLKSYIKNCKDNGISLVVCLDVYYNEYASVANANWISETNGKDGMKNKWFSPEDTEFKNYYLDYIKYILENYEIESVMFDSLRYPKFNENSDLGYDYDTMEKFSMKHEIPIGEVEEIKTKLFDSPHWLKWVEFRMGFVNDMATAISQTVRDVRSDVNLLFVAERDTVDHYYMQNSAEWIKDKLFDGVCVSTYERDGDELDLIGANAYYGGIVSDKLTTFTSYAGNESFVFVGIEASKGLSANLLNQAAIDGRSIGADGFIFSNLKDFIAQNYNLSLDEGVLRGTAVSPLGDLQSSAKKVLDFAKLKIYNKLRVWGGCDEETALAALDKIDAVLAKMDSAPFSYNQAQKIESDMAVTLASAGGKNAILNDFAKLTKMALLYKEKAELPEENPESSVTEESVSEDENEDSAGEIPGEVSESSVDKSETSADVSKSDSTAFEINFGEILIYAIVGFAGVAAIAAMIVGIKRKKSIPSNHHMPKGSAKGYEDKE